MRFVDGGAGIARRISDLTREHSWPDVPGEGIAVFTRLDDMARSLAPALKTYGLTRIVALQAATGSSADNAI